MDGFHLIQNYADENGNVIRCDRPIPCASVRFKGKNNLLVVHAEAKLIDANIFFVEDNASCFIGKTGRFIPHIKLYEGCKLAIGDDVSSTNRIEIIAAEGAEVTIGNDCMFSSGNRIVANEAHAIYDVITGKRINRIKNIKIKDHVWLCEGAVVLHGAHICSGSVIGGRSLVKGRIPNNVLAEGSPARIIEKNIAWERPHVTRLKGVKDEHIERTVEFWSLTKE